MLVYSLVSILIVSAISLHEFRFFFFFKLLLLIFKLMKGILKMKNCSVRVAGYIQAVSCELCRRHSLRLQLS